MGSTTGYDEDFYSWTQATAALIRQQKWHDVDWKHVAEELEALGKRDRRELESRLATLMLHLLKWRFQPERRQRGRSWRRTILEQRRQLAALLADSPSLHRRVSDTLWQLYAHARQYAAAETGLPDETFPAVCPWTASQILDSEFWPESGPRHGPFPKEEDITGKPSE